MVQNFALVIAKEPVSESWVTRFVNRHPSELILKWAAGIDSNRHQADSGVKYKLYFDLLVNKITEYDVDVEHTYNMDEKGFMIGVVSKSKRIFSKRQYTKKQYRQLLQDGNRKWITVLACVGADGVALPLSLPTYLHATLTIRD
jgi:hypothetical protein